MKNKKIIFLAATVCCLVVCWLCFGAWSIADSTFVPSDFAPYANSTYFFIIPSPNITSDSFSNVAFDLVYTSRGNSNKVFSISTTLDSDYFSRLLSKGAYGTSLTTFSSSYSVEIAISISAIDVSLGDYFISAVYVPDSDGNLVDVTSFHSNFVRYSFASGSRRNLIVFVDKLPSGGVSQEQYDDVVDQLEQQQLLNDQLSNDNLMLQEDLSAMQTLYNQVSQQLAQAEQNYTNLQTEFSNLQTNYNQVVNDRDSWERYAHGIEEQLDELFVSNERLQRDYDNLLREYNIIISENESIGFVERAFLAVGNILEIEILPNVSIGTIVSVPLILGVVFLVLRLVRGE